jgi:hypothetical protein
MDAAKAGDDLGRTAGPRKSRIAKKFRADKLLKIICLSRSHVELETAISLETRLPPT